MIITHNQHLMVSSVRRLAALSFNRVNVACEGLSLDYNWNSEVIVHVCAVGISTAESTAVLPLFFNIWF